MTEFIEISDNNIINDELLKEWNIVLKKYFGYDSLKPEQFDVINSIMSDKDTIGIFATGAGKSLNFQMTYLLSKKSIIVISPLVSLILDQYKEMKNRNIDTCIFNNTIDLLEKNNNIKDLLDGKTKLIFMTPEYLSKSEKFIKKLYENDNLKMICIDECHCVSGWSDFRKCYLELKKIKEWVPELPILGLSATLSVFVLKDVKEILNLNNPNIFKGDFDRTNLYFEVNMKTNDTFTTIVKLIKEIEETDYSIIYCLTRDETEMVSIKLNECGIKCKPYHAGLSNESRDIIQKEFINGNFRTICATISFGLGINIPNVKIVIHYNCPKNLDSYIQETGRAGRSINIQARCYLFYCKKDFTTHMFFLSKMNDEKQKKYQQEQIAIMEKYCYSNECRRKTILSNFGQIKETCTNCDNCFKREKQNNIHKSNYINQTYLFVSLLSKFDDKFGSTIFIKTIIGRKIKPEFMTLDEYGKGMCFGKEDWWSNFVQILKINDFVKLNQIKNSFGSTIALTTNGKKWIKKIKEKYPSYSILIKLNNDEKLMFASIEFEEKIKKTLKKIEKTTVI
jgi:ATP-dependent DNA helicase RecQ